VPHAPHGAKRGVSAKLIRKRSGAPRNTDRDANGAPGDPPRRGTPDLSSAHFRRRRTLSN